MAIGQVIATKKRWFYIRRADGKIDISGLDKALVLQALYNGCRAIPGSSMDVDRPIGLSRAQNLVDANPSLVFDVIQTRKLDVDISGDLFDPSGYNAINGEKAGWLTILIIKKPPLQSELW